MGKISVIFTVIMAMTLLASCEQQQADSHPQEVAREVTDALTQERAIARKSRVSNIAYTLDIDLISDPDAYRGRVDAAFDLTSNDTPLTIDFAGGAVSSVNINGAAVDVDYNNYFVTLPAEALAEGRNNISISYAHPYDHDGTGLHRFIDPEDGNTYLYTYLWPYYSNRLFPNFDQPNLKATYEMTVRAKDGWQVVSSVMEDTITSDNGDKIWHFPRSEKFSSYVFSLHAGPYKVWTDTAGDIPVRLMARQSLAPYVAAEEWLGFTKMGLEHYRNYFDIAYPFKKYDQLIVPDFNIGAMENVAAVTFAESYVQRGPSSRFQSQRRASTILHEMAHMWFGDLVTKNWWNGLWLNESFATLMSSIAVSNIPEFKDLWHDFYLSTNLAAIAADNMVSTHPIEVPVPSTADFFSVFDTITYQKGASVLNQLSHHVGKENFRLGVSSYLKKHSWDNTELKDFMAAQSEQFGQDLTPWSDEWLYKAGVNSLKTSFTCDADKITAFTIAQTAAEAYPTLRSQKVQLGLFTTKGDMLEAYAAIPVQVTGASTDVAAAVGLGCPNIAYPNYQGWGYAEVELDATSLDNVLTSLKTVEDPLLRSMFWTAILNNPAVTMEQFIKALDGESNDRIINQVLTALVGKLNRLERTRDPDQMRDTKMLEEHLWALVSKGKSSKSTRIILLGKYIDVARSNVALVNLQELLSGSVALTDLPISQEHRWLLINRLNGRDDKGAFPLFEAEVKTDQSDAGKRAAIAAESALADIKIKKKWLALFMDNDNPLPLSNQRAAMENMFPANQTALQEALLPQMIAALPMIAETRDAYYQRSYARDLFAGICSKDGLAQIKAALDKDKIGTTLYRFLSENVQSAETCQAQRAGK